MTLKLKYTICCLILAAFITTCKSTIDLVPTNARRVSPKEVTSYHKPANMKIGWLPYKDLEFKKTSKDNWVVIKNDSTKEGAIPVILLTYPDSGDSIWLDMNTDNELLGRLMKHTLMTQLPITEPFGDYLVTAACSQCHPSEIKIKF